MREYNEGPDDGYYEGLEDAYDAVVAADSYGAACEALLRLLGGSSPRLSAREVDTEWAAAKRDGLIK